MVIHALEDEEFFGAAVASVYERVTGLTVITTYDRDRHGRDADGHAVVDAVLSRRVDPERKMSLIVTADGSEPANRNRAMAFSRRGHRTRAIPEEPPGIPPPDLWWHIDCDEVYADEDVARLLEHVGRHRARAYVLELRTYFRSWNWRVEERGDAVALCRDGPWWRGGFRFGEIRRWYPSVWARGWVKADAVGVVPRRRALGAMGLHLVPAEVAVCHHGSYVGDRARIARKLERSAHREEVVDRWLEDVWDKWTPDATDFHPTEPHRFPRAVHVPTAELPRAVREHDWPAGWIER